MGGGGGVNVGCRRGINKCFMCAFWHFVTAVDSDVLPGPVDPMAPIMRRQCERVGIWKRLWAVCKATRTVDPICQKCDGGSNYALPVRNVTLFTRRWTLRVNLGNNATVEFVQGDWVVITGLLVRKVLGCQSCPAWYASSGFPHRSSVVVDTKPAEWFV